MTELNDNTFDDFISNGISVIDFYAIWCGPCTAISSVLDKLSVQMPDINFAKVNVEKAQELSAKYKIVSLPTLVFFKNGVPIKTTIGLVSAAVIKKEIDSLKDKK